MLPLPNLDPFIWVSIFYSIELLFHIFMKSESTLESVVGYKFKYKTVLNKKNWKSISYLICGSLMPWPLILINYLTDNQIGFDNDGSIKRFLITLNLLIFILLPVFFVTTHNTKVQKIFYFSFFIIFILLAMVWIFTPLNFEGLFYKFSILYCLLVIINYLPAFSRLY